MPAVQGDRAGARRRSPPAPAGRVRLVKLDIDANLGTPSRYGVLSVPTVILFAGGEARETLVGPHGKSRYERTFAPYLDGRDAAPGTTCSPVRSSRSAPRSLREAHGSSPSRPASTPGSRRRSRASGIDGLYAQQAETWEAAARGENVIVTTGTASGKSLAFNLPVLDAIAREPTARALYLYPTKALTQDQARSLARLRLAGVRPAIYDGDTEPERRAQIRRTANVILTNPDMLHVGILPHHDRWGDVLHNLRYVVVDEAHVYRGVFGSHVGNVLRRLRRLARAYGAEPRFLLASATIANPGELALALTGQAATVDRDGHLGPGASATSSSGTRLCSTRSSAFARARSRRRRS